MEDAVKLAKLLEEYCEKVRDRPEETSAKKRCFEGLGGARDGPERAWGPGDPLAREEALVEEVVVDQDPEEFAWGDVDKIPLSIEQVRRGRSSRW